MKQRATLGFLVLAVTACGSGPTLPSDVGVAGDGELASVLEIIRADHDLPALGAILVRGGQVVESAAAGLRAVGFSEPVTSNDRWHLGSLTKAMTATLAGILVERGTIAWRRTRF